MQGSVTRRRRERKDGGSYVEFRAQVPDPRKPGNPNARMEKVFSAPGYGGIAKARKAADTWRRDTVSAIEAGKWRNPADGAVLVTAVVEQWMQTWPHDLAPKTQVSYRSILASHILPRWGKLRVDALNAADIQAWVDGLGQRRAPQSVHNAYGVLRGLMRLAKARGYITANPCTPDGIKLPSKTKGRNAPRKQLFLEPEELHAIIDALPEHWRTPIWVDALTGLRAGELWGLTRADVDLLHNELHVRRAIKDIAGTLHVGPTKTHAARKLGIPAECLPELKAALAAPGRRVRRVGKAASRGYAAVADGKDGPELGWVPDAHDARRLLFTTPQGHPVSEGNFLRRDFHPAIRAAVAAGALSNDKFIVPAKPAQPGKRQRPDRVAFRVHDLRHTNAAFALQAAGNVEAALTTVMHRLGHKNISTTADIYGHLTRAADKQVAAGISAIVKRPAGSRLIAH